MQIDMHFYATYCLARAAGLRPDIAKTIATAAQFVDDATEDTPLLRDDAAFHVPVASSHEMHDKKNLKPIDQWHVWVPYHFLPGNRGASWEERLICRRGDATNASANAIIEHALGSLALPHGAHLLGVTTHVLQDTYSHAGFIGISSQYNSVIQSSIDIRSISNQQLLNDKRSLICAIVEMLAAPGHAAVDCCPDYPYLYWSFEYQYGNDVCPRRHGDTYVERDNREEFALACERLHGVFVQATKRGPVAWRVEQPQKDFWEIELAVQDIIAREASREARSNAWIRALRNGVFCEVEEEDNDLGYDETAWKLETHEGREFRPGSDPVLFQRASHQHRNFVHSELLPRLMPSV